MSSEIAIQTECLGKCYHIYDKPHDRLLQMLARGYKQYYREFWALSNVSFTINKGETVGIIGRNGSGKSTLLQLICGTLNPTNGTIKVNGRVAALLELGAGFNPEFSGRDNVYLAASLYGLSKEQTDERFAAILQFADIGDFVWQPVKTYSSGMMVRLAFAVIAHVDADILVIDEALAVGDAFFTQKCMRFLRNFMKTGTILFVSHDTASIKSLCNRAIWLEKGKVIQEGSPKRVCADYLQAFFEEQQGKNTLTKVNPVRQDERASFKDQRMEFINSSNLRNDLQVFSFNPDIAGFGTGGATIINVLFTNAAGEGLAWIVGGEFVKLTITAVLNIPLDAPIMGFYIKDKLGQNLFGDNTYLSYMDNPLSCESGDVITAEFGFQMPRLAKGDYTVGVAVANGTQEEHQQQHWIHDALVFRSEFTSVAAGLIGISMTHIQLSLDRKQNMPSD